MKDKFYIPLMIFIILVTLRSLLSFEFFHTPTLSCYSEIFLQILKKTEVFTAASNDWLSNDSIKNAILYVPQTSFLSLFMYFQDTNLKSIYFVNTLFRSVDMHVKIACSVDTLYR